MTLDPLLTIEGIACKFAWRYNQLIAMLHRTPRTSVDIMADVVNANAALLELRKLEALLIASPLSKALLDETTRTLRMSLLQANLLESVTVEKEDGP